MSIAEFPSNSSRGKNNSAEFERTPPQDVIAEQSVLGGMLLSKDAISDVVEILRMPRRYPWRFQRFYILFKQLMLLWRKRRF